MNKLPAVITAIVALALVCVAAAIGVKMKKQFSADVTAAENPETVSYEDVSSPGETEYIPADTEVFTPEFFTEQPAETLPPVTSALTQPSAVITQASGRAQTDVSAPEESSLTERITSAVTTVATTIVNTAFNEAFSMPRVPKYIPSESRIDFNTASLASYKYDPNGNYYYTNDKSAWQKGFGYNQIYDNLAVMSAMYYDTVRTTFNYEGKEWLIQIWKGQYGYYFVGEEIGVYTKTGSTNTYSCADKSDWLRMEMCFVWDENKDGNYQPRFARSYTDYWWCTGFVVGYESTESMKSREQFRMVAHITFKTEEMAQLFANAFEANGFRRVAKLDNSVKDTFVRIGPDVAFVWQSINQHVI